MAAGPYSIDPTTYLDELLAQASPDLMREMLQGFINQILSTQADQVCGADYATVSQDRVNTRNGYRHRDFDTRVGTVDVAVPKLRTGSFFPDWLLERRTRASAGPDHRDRHLLPERCVHPQDERPGGHLRDQQPVEIPGVRHGQGSRCRCG